MVYNNLGSAYMRKNLPLTQTSNGRKLCGGWKSLQLDPNLAKSHFIQWAILLVVTIL
jgi:hypothetical protein